MKPLIDIEKNRISYHSVNNKNTVHRSSLLVARFKNASTNISFLNHFYLKRRNLNVILKITAVDSMGNFIDSQSIKIDSAIVYSIYLEDLFNEWENCNEYIVEFFTNENLYIPFPAVMINHIGKDLQYDNFECTTI
jgi:hypothetical protein